jgi:hypothetical protein
MVLIGDSLLMPLVLAGPLLIGCCWLLWVVLGRPGGAKLHRPAKSDRRAAISCLVLLGVSGGLLVAVNIVSDLIRKADDRAYVRDRTVREVVGALAQYQADHGRPAAGPDDLAPYEGGWPWGVAAIRRGEVVVLWGRSVEGPSDDRVPVAHERLDVRGKVRVAWSDGSWTREDAAAVARLAEQPPLPPPTR